MLEHSTYLREYQLQQITPMIHFQHSQLGAVLRPTQVKPLLDRFLTQELRREGKELPAQWLLPDNSASKDAPPSLSYKMTITATCKPRQTTERARLLSGDDPAMQAARNALPQMTGAPLRMPGTYFANMPLQSLPRAERIDWILHNVREAILFPEPLCMTIFCRFPSLQVYIAEKLRDFFLLHSFGTRTSKGFGSFVLEGTTEEDALRLYRERYPQFIYFDGVPSKAAAEGKAISCAASIVQLMKSGINHDSWVDGNKRKKNPLNRGYQKSHLVQYFAKNGIGSEKRFLKSCGALKPPYPAAFDLDSPHSRPEHFDKVEKFQFIRALLGLADHITFRDNVFHDEVSILSLDGSIERFRCPITVRITNQRIYFLPEPYPDAFLGKTFVFLTKSTAVAYKNCHSENEKREFLEQQHQRGMSLQVPAQFDLAAFILDFGREYNNFIAAKINTSQYSGILFRNITSLVQRKSFTLVGGEEIG